MELTPAQFDRIATLLPRQRGNVVVSNHQLINALLYVLENGCKWRSLPAHFGPWHTIYTRMNRWSKNGVIARVFVALQQQQVLRLKIDAVSLDSTIVKVHPDGTGARKKTAAKPLADPVGDGPPSFIWLPQMLVRRSPAYSQVGKWPMARKGGRSSRRGPPPAPPASST